MKPAIMIVDDDPSVLDALETELASDFSPHFLVEAYGQPEEALDAGVLWHRQGREIAVIIADQKMPVMTGVELIDRLRQSGFVQMQGIVLTGYAGLESAIAALNQAGVQRYLEKPWDPVALRATICDLVSGYLRTSGVAEYYTFQEVTTAADLEALLCLRLSVCRIAPSGGDHFQELDEGFDVDEYDSLGRFFAVFHHGQEGSHLVGALRVTESKEGPAAALLRELVAGHPTLEAHLKAPRRLPLPLMNAIPDSRALQELYWRLRQQGEHAFEAGRLSLDPSFRCGFSEGIFLARHVVSSALARYFMHLKVENGFIACDVDQARFHEAFGFRPAEGTDAEPHGTPGRPALACLHARQAWIPYQTQFLLRPLTQRWASISTTCHCSVYPECLPEPFEHGGLPGADIFCPWLANRLINSGRDHEETRSPAS